MPGTWSQLYDVCVFVGGSMLLSADMSFPVVDY